jgi:hypothetical protein
MASNTEFSDAMTKLSWIYGAKNKTNQSNPPLTKAKD